LTEELLEELIRLEEDGWDGGGRHDREARTALSAATRPSTSSTSSAKRSSLSLSACDCSCFAFLRTSTASRSARMGSFVLTSTTFDHSRWPAFVSQAVATAFGVW